MKKRWAYILIGNDRTGKTTFQKIVLRILTGKEVEKLNCNNSFDLDISYGLNWYKTIFLMNRSFQEKQNDYGSVEEYFDKSFKDSDICILSSHLDEIAIGKMLQELRKRFYNIGGVFFSNSVNRDSEKNKTIASLDWQERLFIENDEAGEEWEYQLERNAHDFVNHIISK